MHVAFVRIARSYYDLTESERSRAVELDAYDITILYACFFRLRCGQVNVSLSYDDCLLLFQLLLQGLPVCILEYLPDDPIL